MMQRVTYYVACSVDGFIAHNDGDVKAFYGRDSGFDFVGSLAAFDVLLMGRKTYDLSRRLGDATDPNKENYVFLQTLNESLDQNVDIISEDPAPFVKGLKSKAGKDIWLVGGAELATTLFKENLIDDMIIKVNPVLFGSGISLFSSIIKETELDLLESKVYQNSFMVNHYCVKQ
jgi:dihydrofolate reductase